MTEQKGKRHRQHDDDDPDGRRRNEQIPGPGRCRLRLCRPRHPRRFGRTVEGDHDRTSGSDDGYGRIAEAAAGGG